MSRKSVRAAGMLLFRVNILKEVQYLLMRASYGEKHWSPPKGHLDSGETDMQAAIRETKEEAGFDIQDYQVLKFERSLHYEVRGRPKTSVYYLAELTNISKEVTMSDEHIDYKWLPLKEAKVLAKYQDLCDLLDECETFISYCLDGGLFVPQEIPIVSDISSWRNLSYLEVLGKILRIYIAEGELTDDELQGIIRKAFSAFETNEVVKIASLQDGTTVAELFHGPSLSFKDLGISVLANMMEFFCEKEDRHMLVLVGTSGDTGGSAVEAIKSLKRVKLIVLYPRGMCSEFQELQMATCTSPNVRVVEVAGTSDDLDVPIKQCFLDPDIVKKYSLGSMNSVNWVRILVQAAHYVYVSMNSPENGSLNPVTCVVPSGAAGNLAAGCIAATMGFPVRIIPAVNENDFIARFLAGGQLASGTVKPTHASAMDIQVPYNIERAIYFYSQSSEFVKDIMDKFNDGEVSVPQEILRKMKEHVTDADNAPLTSSSRYTVTAVPSRSRANSESLILSTHSQPPTDSSLDQGGQRWRGIRAAFSRWRKHGGSRHSSPSSGVASDDSFGDPPLSPTSVHSEKFHISCSSRTRVFAHPHRGPVTNLQANIYSRLPPVHSNKHFSFVRALRRRKLREKSKSDQDLHGSKINLPPSRIKDDSGLSVFATVRLPRERRETPSIFSTFWTGRGGPRRCDDNVLVSEQARIKEQESDGSQLTPVPLPRRASKDSRCGTPFLSVRPRSRSLERFSGARVFPSFSGVGIACRSRSLERNQKFSTDRKESLTPSTSGTLAPKKRSRSVENASRIHPCDELALARTTVSKFSNSPVGQWKTFSEVFGSSSGEGQKKGPISSVFQDLLLSNQGLSSTIVCGDREAPILGRHLVAGGEIIVAWLPKEGNMDSHSAVETPGGSFMNKPTRGWLHHDQQLVREGVSYQVMYIGCVAVNTSMKSLDFDTRSLIAKECINRVCEAAGVRAIGRKKPTDKKLLRILGDRPVLTSGGSDVTLVVNSTFLKLTSKDGTPIACHEMPNISFASGGDPETLDFVAYVAKDSRYGRSCFVLKCTEVLAQDVITTVGQAFELRFKEYLKRAPKSGSDHPHPPLPRQDDPDYYNDLPGKVAPDLATPVVTALPAMTLKRSSPSETRRNGDARDGDDHDAVHPRISPQPPRASPVPSTSSAVSHHSTAGGHPTLRTRKESNLIDFSSEGAVPSIGNPKHSIHEYVNTPPSMSTPAAEDPFNTGQLQSSLPSPLVPPPFSPNLPGTSSGLPPRLSPGVQKAQLHQESWYHGPISRKDAENLLKNDGEFLVRESQSSSGQYVLSGLQQGNFKHLLLVDPEGVVRTKDRVFDSVSHLINYHCTNSLPIVSAESALVLRIPVRRTTPFH